MSSVTISGYSGQSGETGGGAMRIRKADYTTLSHTSSNPTLTNVTVSGGCRGFRLQDCTSAYVYNCTASNVSDNAFYFAAGGTATDYGCVSCTFDTCTATSAGQAALQSIGGLTNYFKNSTVSGSRGAAVSCYFPLGAITVDNCEFTNANTSHTTTPWGGATDDFAGAAVGMSSADTTSVYVSTSQLIVKNCTFHSGDGAVFHKAVSSYGSDLGDMDVSTGNSYDSSGFASLQTTTSETITGISNVTDSNSSGGDPYINPVCGKCYKLPPKPATYRYLNCTVPRHDFIVNANTYKPEGLTSEIYAHMQERHMDTTMAGNDVVMDGYYFQSFYIFHKDTHLVVNMDKRSVATTHQLFPLNDIVYFDNGVFTVKGNPCDETINMYPHEKEHSTYKLCVYTNHAVYGKVCIAIRFFSNPQLRTGITIQTQHNITMDNSQGALVCEQDASGIKIPRLKYKGSIKRKHKCTTKGVVYETFIKSDGSNGFQRALIDLKA